MRRHIMLVAAAVGALIFGSAEGRESPPASIIHLAVDYSPEHVAQAKTTFLLAMRERGLTHAELDAIQFVAAGNGPEDMRRFAAGISRDSARVLVVPTLLMLKTLLPIEDR